MGEARIVLFKLWPQLLYHSVNDEEVNEEQVNVPLPTSLQLFLKLPYLHWRLWVPSESSRLLSHTTTHTVSVSTRYSRHLVQIGEKILVLQDVFSPSCPFFLLPPSPTLLPLILLPSSWVAKMALIPFLGLYSLHYLLFWYSFFCLSFPNPNHYC